MKRHPKSPVGSHSCLLLLTCTLLYTKFLKVYAEPQCLHVSRLSLPRTVVSNSSIVQCHTWWKVTWRWLKKWAKISHPTLHFLISATVHIHCCAYLSYLGTNGRVIYCTPGEHLCQQAFRQGSVSQKVIVTVHMQWLPFTTLFPMITKKIKEIPKMITTIIKQKDSLWNNVF